MKANLRISFALVMILVLMLPTSLSVSAGSKSLMDYSTAAFTTINFVPNIQTIGVAVSGAGLPSTADLAYRQNGESFWHAGQPLVRIPDGRLIGSLFNLSAATSYEIKVSDGASEISGTISTQPDQLSFTPSMILYVNDDAQPGGDGSSAAPFRTIQQAVNQAGPGTQILVADGTYREAVTFPRSGTAGNWIQVKGAGNAAILDSADRLSGAIWTLYSGSHVWFTRISGPVAYLARGGNRFYQYDDKNGLLQARGHGGVTINEGWYYEAGTQRLYVRSQDSPANYVWRVPRLNHAFDIATRDWVWIEGFEVRFYGTTTNGCGVCTLNASHVVIRKNKIHNMQLGIFINWIGTTEQGNDTRLEANEVYDPLVNEWPWAAVKGSYMEGTGIIIRGHVGAIVRDNNVHNFFNGIFTGSSGALENPELAFDADIYQNYIHHVSDDGLEPEGACINQRFRNNIIDRSFIGISLAPITQGPTWVLRNTFANFTGRGIKFADNSDGIVLIYHNTGWTSAANVNGADLITSIHNVKMRNNIFQSTGYTFYEVPTGSTGNSWNNDNWYTTRGSTGPHFKWENVNYNTIFALCVATNLECNGYETPPGFSNPAGGDFTLLSSSPNIDRGILLPGINDDFTGNAPDVGAYEFVLGPPPTVLSSIGVDPNPTSAPTVSFKVTFSEPVSGVDLSAPFNDFYLTNMGLTGAAIQSVTPISGSAYIVSVNTGVGTGTLRLDIIDDDSIKDAANQPLGGSGLGNGNFTSGEIYTVSRPPNVDVTIGEQPAISYFVPPHTGTNASYENIDDGPVKLVNTEGGLLISSMQINLKSMPTYSSYTEFIGIPAGKLTDTYLFPWYNNANAGGLSSQLRIGNVGTASTTVTIKIGGVAQMPTYPLAPNESARVTLDNVDAGPVEVKSSDGVPIIASMRVNLKANIPDYSSYTEFLGLSASSTVGTKYIFPWYNNANIGRLSSQLRIGNVGNTSTTVTIKIGGVTQPQTYTLAPNESARATLDNVDNGPVEVSSSGGIPIIAAMRVNLKTNPIYSSYSEFMGLPGVTLSETRYLFPWYNNATAGGLSSQLRFGNVGNTTTTVTIKIGGVTQPQTYTLAPLESARATFDNVDSGPVEVFSSGGVPIIASMRVNLKANAFYSSYTEFMGLSVGAPLGMPGNQLSTTYWFPWYNNATNGGLSSQLQFGVP